MHNDVLNDGEMPTVALLIGDPGLEQITCTIIGLSGICVRRIGREGQERVSILTRHCEVVVTTLSSVAEAKATDRARMVVVDNYLFEDPASVGLGEGARLDGTRLLQSIFICHRRLPFLEHTRSVTSPHRDRHSKR